MEGTIGEIRMFAANFAPKFWALCQGQLLPIQQNQALFSILGTTYGGNGQTTFALPDLRGRVAVGFGNGADLSPNALGQMAGTETVTMLQTNMPAHNHQMIASNNPPTTNVTDGASLASNNNTVSPPMPNIYVAGAPNPVPMASQTGTVGGNLPINNIQPYLSIEYIICMQGIFPSRN
jgi:microcystin-dependent protein